MTTSLLEGFKYQIKAGMCSSWGFAEASKGTYFLPV